MQGLSGKNTAKTASIFHYMAGYFLNTCHHRHVYTVFSLLDCAYNFSELDYISKGNIMLFCNN